MAVRGVRGGDAPLVARRGWVRRGGGRGAGEAEAETRRGDAGRRRRGAGRRGRSRARIPAGPAAAARRSRRCRTGGGAGGGGAGAGVGRRPETAEGLTWRRRCWGDAIRMRCDYEYMPSTTRIVRSRARRARDRRKSWIFEPAFLGTLSGGFRCRRRSGRGHSTSRVLGRFRAPFALTRVASASPMPPPPSDALAAELARLARVAEARESAAAGASDDAAPYLAEVARRARAAHDVAARRAETLRGETPPRECVARPSPRALRLALPRRVPPRVRRRAIARRHRGPRPAPPRTAPTARTSGGSDGGARRRRWR